MTIVAATLPQFEAGATLEEGQTFDVEGTDFDRWPDELVLGYNTNYVEDSAGRIYAMELVEKTSNKLTFRVRETYTYSQNHVWGVFGSPNEIPRGILEYTAV